MKAEIQLAAADLSRALDFNRRLNDWLHLRKENL
jgi:hypothetical protein